MGINHKYRQKKLQHIFKSNMASAGAPVGGSKHGGSRSVLCWQDKLALCDENVILEFIQTAKCMNKCKCFDKVRALGKDKAMDVVRGIREARMGSKFILFQKIVVTFGSCGDIVILPHTLEFYTPGV